MAIWSNPSGIGQINEKYRRLVPPDLSEGVRIPEQPNRLPRMGGGSVSIPKNVNVVPREAVRRRANRNGISFVTQNIQGGAGSKADLRAKLRNLLEDSPDLIGFGELRGERADLAKRFLARRGYGFRGDHGTPYAWNKDELKFKRGGSEFLTPRTFVGQAGAGPSTLKAKYANWAKFRDRDTGRRIVATTAHLAPSIYLPERRRLHTQQVRGIADLQRQFGRMFPKADRLVMGDMNTSKARRLRPIMNSGLEAYRPMRRTHKAGFIDWLLSDADIRNRWIKDYGSDHRGYGGVL